MIPVAGEARRTKHMMVNLSPDEQSRLAAFTALETQRVGYPISLGAVVRAAIREYIDTRMKASDAESR